MVDVNTVIDPQACELQKQLHLQFAMPILTKIVSYHANREFSLRTMNSQSSEPYRIVCAVNQGSMVLANHYCFIARGLRNHITMTGSLNGKEYHGCKVNLTDIARQARVLWDSLQVDRSLPGADEGRDAMYTFNPR